TGRKDITKAMTADEIAREQQLRKQLQKATLSLANEQRGAGNLRAAPLRADLDRIKRERDEFLLALYSRHPELRVSRAGMEPATLKELAQMLPDSKAGLVEFAVSDEGAIAFVIRKDRPAAVVALNVNDLDLKTAAEDLRAKLANRDLAFRGASANVYARL